MVKPAAPPSTWQVGCILGIGLLAYSFGSILVRLAMGSAEAQGLELSLFLASGRLCIASLCLLPLGRGFKPTAYPLTTIQYSLWAGLCLAIYFATWVTALNYTSIAATTTLSNTSPLWVALISWLWFKTRPKLLTWLGCGLALSGCALISVLGSPTVITQAQPFLGNGLALLAGVMFAGYLLLGRSAQYQGLPIHHHTLLVTLTAGCILLPLPPIWGVRYTDYSIWVYFWMGLSAILPQLVGHMSFNWSVRWISPLWVTLVLLAEPVLASVWAYWCFGESLTWAVAQGAALVLVGVGAVGISDRA